MSDKIHKFFECLIPITACNLKCEYCYVRQLSWDNGDIPHFNYPVSQMLSSLTQDRLGGICYFSICATGETTFCTELPQLIAGLLKLGHYVSITTNGTFTKGMTSIINGLPKEFRDHFHVAFSLHYNELLRLNLLDEFTKNVLAVREAGSSILVQLNLYDGYNEVIDDIKGFCMKNFGGFPQVAATRFHECGVDGLIRFHTALCPTDYFKMGTEFHSPLFDFTYKNFNVHRKGFCYAGHWSYLLNLQTGMLRACYANGRPYNIFKSPNEKFPEFAVGSHCHNQFCQNGSHFLALGVMPDVCKETSYAKLRDRAEAGWYQPAMRDFLSGKLCEDNPEYCALEKLACNTKRGIEDFVYNMRKIAGQAVRRIFHG